MPSCRNTLDGLEMPSTLLKELTALCAIPDRTDDTLIDRMPLSRPRSMSAPALYSRWPRLPSAALARPGSPLTHATVSRAFLSVADLKEPQALDATETIFAPRETSAPYARPGRPEIQLTRDFPTLRVAW